MNILQFLQDQDGRLSSARLLNFLIAVALIVDWMHAVFTVGQWHPDLNLVLILLTTVTGKTVQSFAEGASKPPQPQQP